MKIGRAKLVWLLVLLIFLDGGLFASQDLLSRDLRRRNVSLSGYWGKRVQKELQIKGRVEYVLKGKVPLGFLPLNFLFEHLPLTAKMVNAYQGTSYQIRYLDSDKKRLLAKIKGLKGRMNLLSPRQQVDRRVYYGDGDGKILWWHLYGTVLVLVDISGLDERSCSYQLRIFLFNESAFVNRLLSLGVVRWAIKGRIEKILAHIVQSALQFRQDGGKALQGDESFAGTRQREFLQEFLHLDSQSSSD